MVEGSGEEEEELELGEEGRSRVDVAKFERARFFRNDVPLRKHLFGSVQPPSSAA